MGTVSKTGRATFSRISVIIANYNYAGYVGTAIESALALDWPDVEVIVVDDGSTDGSREVIAGYRDARIVTLFQENASQRVARNRGYELSTGDVIIHLDSDDVLLPELPRAMAAVWREGISKVQFQMMRIGQDGSSLGSVFPAFSAVPSSAEVRRWAERTSTYPTPPGSGNAYTRAFLDQIFPLDDSCGTATDSYCITAAPFSGDVVTIPRPLAGYRLHGRNESNMLSSPDRFHDEVARAKACFGYQTRLAGTRADPRQRPLFRGRHLLQLRVAALRMQEGPPVLPGDGRGRMLWGAVCSPFWPGGESVRMRIMIVSWCLMTLLAPTTVARRLITMRFAQRT